MSKQSKIVGSGTNRAGCAVRVYEAVAVIPCQDCGARILPGDRFLRVGIPGGGTNRTYPVCRQCERFTERAR